MNILSFDVDHDGVAKVVIDIPRRPMNVLTPELNLELEAAIERIASDGAIKGAVLTSGKAGCFVAGADLTALGPAIDRGVTAKEGAAMAEPTGNLFRRLETCGKPVVALVNGLALGGGLELALACHYRVLINDPKAVVGLPEVQLGLLPGAGGTQRLPRMIGVEKALDLLLTGRSLKPDEALKLGVVDEVVEADHAFDVARARILSPLSAQRPWDVKGYRVPGGVGPMAPYALKAITVGTTYAAKQTQRNVPSPLAIMSAVYEGVQLPIDRGLAIERKYFGTLLASPVARNLIRTMFINKNAADKLTQRPKGVPPTKLNKIGILGAGMMGAGIALAAAQSGLSVVLLDRSIEFAEKGKQYARKAIEKATSRGKLSPEKAEAQLALIHTTDSYADLAGCDFIIEAVFEDRKIKAGVTQKTAEVVAKDCVFGTNTSTLPVSGLAEAYPWPDRFIGVHFFSPAERMPLLEIIVGKSTSDATLAAALDLAARLRKTPIIVNDSRGFFTSRVFGYFIKEGIAMLQEGVAPALIENAARQAGFPVGPLEVCDEVSLDITLRVYDQWVSDGVPPPYEPELSINAVRKMTEQSDRHGRAAGAGFYEYPADGKKFLWPGLAQLFPAAAEQPPAQEVKERLLFAQALEASRAVEEGVVSNPADADLGSILGIGYPAWTGGVLSYIETVGLREFIAKANEFAEKYGDRFCVSPWLIKLADEKGKFYFKEAAE